MPNPVTVKLHRVNIIGCDRLSGGRVDRAGTCLGAFKDRECADNTALVICRERFQLVVAVRDRAEKVLHPVGVAFHRGDVGEGVGLAREDRPIMAVPAAAGPSFTRFAGFKECAGGFGNAHSTSPSSI